MNSVVAFTYVRKKVYDLRVVPVVPVILPDFEQVNSNKVIGLPGSKMELGKYV
jgi:hypothetical protein